jgi:L-gulonolactone oxidase
VPAWRSWDGVQRCEPQALLRPAGEGEVAAAVRDAAERGLTVKAVGSGHSFSDCACTEGTMVDLSRMDRVLDVDRVSGLVRVEAGITLHRLGRELARHGLALENQGDIDAQALGGALATATHGTGERFANLAARVEALRLVTASGAVLDLTADRDPEDLRAARVSLGALGIVTEVTLRAVPLFALHRRDAPRPLEEMLDRLDELAADADHFEFWVFPYTRTALTRTCTREPAGATRPSRGEALRRRLQEDVVENRALGAVCALGRARPAAVPRLNRLIAGAMTSSEVRDHAHRVFPTTRAVRFTESEYAVPRARAREAVERVLGAIEERRLPVTFPLEIRFTAATTPSCRPPTGARPATWPSTRSTACRSSRSWPPARRSSSSSAGARTGESGTPGRRGPSWRCIRAGSASRPCAPASIPAAPSRAPTPSARSGPWVRGTSCPRPVGRDLVDHASPATRCREPKRSHSSPPSRDAGRPGRRPAGPVPRGPRAASGPRPAPSRP